MYSHIFHFQCYLFHVNTDFHLFYFWWYDPLMAHFFTFYVSEKHKLQSCPTLCNPKDCTIHRILQARILECIAFPFPRGSSQPRDWTNVSHTAGRFFTSWATREAWYWEIVCQLSNWKLAGFFFFPFEYVKTV